MEQEALSIQLSVANYHHVIICTEMPAQTAYITLLLSSEIYKQPHFFFHRLEPSEVNGERVLLITVELRVLSVIPCKKEGDKKDA